MGTGYRATSTGIERPHSSAVLNANRHETPMSYPDLSPLEELSGPFALLSKGPKFIAAWLAERTEERYREFTRAALEGQVFPENAEAMTSEDFLAMLRALELDIEAEKATVYGRLACSIATGKTAGHLKRQFIKALSDLSFGQVDLLRRAWIAERHDVFPGTGGGNLDPKEFLGLRSKSSINRQTFERWGLIEEKGLSLAGRRFVEACFTSEELVPSSVGRSRQSNQQLHLRLLQPCPAPPTPGLPVTAALSP